MDLVPVRPTKWLFGFIDASGALVIEPIFHDAWHFARCSLAAVIFGRKNGFQSGYIDLKGRTVIHPQFEGARSFDDLGLV
jgi:hypothetical protein